MKEFKWVDIGDGKPVKVQVPDVDALAQFIRSIDGDHKMGAGALAEKIVEWLTDSPAKAQDTLQRFENETLVLPVVNAQFEVVDGDITGTTEAPVKRVEVEDDGSLTVVVDHWPEWSGLSKAQVQEGRDAGD